MQTRKKGNILNSNSKTEYTIEGFKYYLRDFKLLLYSCFFGVNLKNIQSEIISNL